MVAFSRLSVLSTVSTVVLVALIGIVIAKASSQDAADLADLQSFSFNNTLPYDVNGPLVSQLDSSRQIPQAQRLFDKLAWQAFLALNWPANSDGTPKPIDHINDEGPRVWDYWRTVDSIFLPQGATPDSWGTAGTYPASNSDQDEELYRAKAAWTQHLDDAADENFQAFGGPLVDQNGNWVRYEVLVNHEEFKYIFDNQLYNLEGQAAYLRQGNKIDYPLNNGDTTHGAIEVKLAWKQLDPSKDDISRFYHTWAVVNLAEPFVDGKPLQKRIPIGLVGMHIAMRTQSSPEWIWATFEQVDNCAVNDLTTQSHPSFNNPDLPTLPVNQTPPMNAILDPNTGSPMPAPPGTTPTTWIEHLTTTPTQLARVIPIPLATQQLNEQVQAILRAKGSVFQYYSLIGTQWPLNPSAPAIPGGEDSAPESIINKTPGDMIPVFLTNMTMETSFQQGLQKAGGMEQDNRLTSNDLTDDTIVYGTESCVGCHYSAGACIGFRKDAQGNPIVDPITGKRIPIFGENANFGDNGNAEFSWLLQIEAKSKFDPVTSAAAAKSPSAQLNVTGAADAH